MRGKEAAKAANRRTTTALEEVERLRAELKEESSHQSDLKNEIQRLKTEHFKEASRIAGEEVKRQLARIEKERRDRGLSDDIVNHMLYRKDMLIRNACRYISMTKGFDPYQALQMVLTWCTDKDFREGKGMARSDFLIELGVPLDGWVAGRCRVTAQWTTKGTQYSATSLDNAERQGHPDIHPLYTKNAKHWYPNIDYGGIVVVDQDEEERPGNLDLLVAERDGVI